MVILDTNVIAALMRSEPDPIVIDWLDKQPPGSSWITSITLFESRFGLGVLPNGKRKTRLTAAFDDMISSEFADHLLTFDSAAAAQAAELAVLRKKAGRPVDMRDTFIAGIALAHRSALATRNTRHFSDLPLEVINPWGADE